MRCPGCTSNRKFDNREEAPQIGRAHAVHADEPDRLSIGYGPGWKGIRMLNRITRALSPASRRVAAALMLVLALTVGCLGGCTQTTASTDSGSAAATAPAGSASTGSAAASDDQQIAVQVVVDSSAADGSVTFDGTVELAEGATVLDAIEATGLELDVQDSEYGAFVNAIGGLATGDAGDASGWGYDLTGEMVMESADVATVADGDVLTWTYLV